MDGQLRVVCYRLAHIRLMELNKELIEALLKGDIEAVKQHIAAGADVNAKDAGGGTPFAGRFPTSSQVHATSVQYTLTDVDSYDYIEGD